MTHILFIIIIGGASPVIHQTEFNSLESCVAAGNSITRTISGYSSAKVFAQCHAKGEQK